MSFAKLIVPLGLVLATSAAAQTPSQPPQPRQETFVRVQTSISFYLPGPTGEGDEAQKLRDRARRTVYEMAGRECDLAREVLARDCRLESVNNNINANRHSGSQQPEGYNVTGSMTLQITLK